MGIEIKNVSYFYDLDSYKIQALKNISLTIKKHKMTAIIGKTGCGKTTLMQHLNALLKPSEGEVIVDEFHIQAKTKNKSLKNLRAHVGLVFQFSENQLFEETVAKDIAFGPSNFNVDKAEIQRRVEEVIELVGLDASYLERSCFQLSGGQKRRVAIAGILAMNPEIIILDEPTAGLDPQGAMEMMNLFKKLQVDYGKTIIIVTHDMDQVYEYCDEVILLDKGMLVAQEATALFFEQHPEVEMPKILRLKKAFEQKGMQFKHHPRSIIEVLKEVQAWER